MNYSLNEILDGYFERHQIELKKRNTVGRFSKNPKIEKALLRENENRLSIFIQDALFLFNLDSPFQSTSIKEPRLNEKRVPQYFLLTKIQLEAYIGFRTALRKNIKPKVNFNQFYVIYINELLNGLYTKDVDEIFLILVNLLSLRKKGKKSDEIFLKAFEALFLISGDKNLEDFRIACGFNIFETIEDESCEFDIPRFEYLFKQSTIKKSLTIKPSIKYLMNMSFHEILTKLENCDYHLSSYEDESIKDLFKLRENVNYLNKWGYFYVNFFSRTLKFINVNSREKIEAKNGLLIQSVYEFSQYQIQMGYSFLKKFNEFFCYCCGKEKQNSLQDNSEKRNTYFEKYFTAQKKNDEKLEFCINSWLEENPKYKNAYNLSLEQLFSLEKIDNFKLDLKKADSIKTQSVKIQDKLIIEDFIDEAKLTIPEEKKTEEIEVEENIFQKFINSLSQSEKILVKEILKNNINIPLYCRKNKLNYLLIIDSINEKANQYIEDIIIEDDIIIEEYRLDLEEII